MEIFSEKNISRTEPGAKLHPIRRVFRGLGLGTEFDLLIDFKIGGE